MSEQEITALDNALIQGHDTIEYTWPYQHGFFEGSTGPDFIVYEINIRTMTQRNTANGVTRRIIFLPTCVSPLSTDLLRRVSD